MTEKQIKQNAEEYATSQYGEYDEHDYTDHSGRNMCHAVSEKAFIAGAHSRDKEIKELKQKLHEEKDFGDFKDTQINSLKDQLRNPWISVKDRLPNDGDIVYARSVLIIEGGGERSEEEQYLTQKYMGRWITDEMKQHRMNGVLYDITVKVTHWMPIPAIPK